MQGPLDGTAVTVTLNAGVEYHYCIGAFTLGSATDLIALR